VGGLCFFEHSSVWLWHVVQIHVGQWVGNSKLGS